MDRFWAKVKKGTGDECWEWQAFKDRQGYGQTGLRNVEELRAHRYSWFLMNGPIPPGHYIRHSCHNPGCVNPAHLSSGTPQENSDDMVRSGRSNTKLTEEQVGSIRRSYVPWVMGYFLLGKIFGVTKSSIENIVKGATWSTHSYAWGEKLLAPDPQKKIKAMRRLAPEIRAEILGKYVKGAYGWRRLAKEYGCSTAAVKYIVKKGL
jgi:hypothetical protein